MGALAKAASRIENLFAPSYVKFEKNLRQHRSAVGVPAQISLEDKSLSMANIVPQMYQAWGAYGYLPSITWYQLANMYVSWTFAAINKKATTIAAMPMRLFRYESKQSGKTILPHTIKHQLATCNSLYSGEEKRWKVLKEANVKRIEITEHPLLDLLNEPNPDFVRSNFWQLAFVHLFLNGALGIYKAKRVFGNPTELHIIPTTWTGNLKPVPGDGRTVISGYKLIDLDIQEDFGRDEIIWPHFPSLRNPYEGMSPLKANLYSFDIDQYMLQQINAVYKNGQLFSHVLGTDQVLDQDVYDDMKKQAQGYEGAKNSGQMFITHGGMKYLNPQTSTAKEAMVVEIEAMVRDRLLSGEDVSAGKMGLTEKQNRANLQVVNENYYNEAILPPATLFTEYIDKELVSGYDNRLSFEFGYPSFEDRDQNLKEREINLSTGYHTINEERIKNGEPEVPWGAIPLIASNMMPLGSEPPTPTLPKKPVGEGGDSDALEPEGNNPEPPKGLRTKLFWTDEKKAIAWKRFDRLAKGYEKPFVGAAQKHFKWLESFIIDKLESSGVKMKANIAAMSRQHKLEYLAEHKDKLNDFLPDKITIRASLKSLFKPIYESTLAGAAGDRAEQLDMDLDFNVNADNVKEWLGDKLETFSDKVSDTEIKMTKDLLREDFANGESLVNMSDHLKDIFSGNEARAHAIARTESTAAYNKGDLEAVKQLGVRAKKIWLAEPTARDTHAKAGEDYADGVELDEDFKVGDDTMDAPGNGELAEENCNCRCSMVYDRGEA